jgi:allophanate hydrolase
VTKISAVARVRGAYARIAEVDRPEAWITLRDQGGVLAEAARMDIRLAAGEDLPLCGTVIAVKDNIDVAGLPTTAGCPSFAYVPETSALAVARLTDRGAVVLGKTNLDQFATGLVGTRSPYGAVRCATSPDRISGGSSSGSAVVVALGIADLALGTDTAGSGRIPAAFQGIVGFKPTIGLIPTVGVVPAARSFDCVSVFAPTVAAAETAAVMMSGPVPGDPTWRGRPADAPLAAPAVPRIAVPASAQLAGLSPAWIDAFEGVVQGLASAGADIVTVDLAPFLAAGDLLYGGAFVAERFAAVGSFIEAHPDDIDPCVRAIIGAAGSIPAHRLVSDIEHLGNLRRRALRELTGADVLVVPTVPEHPRLADVEADPIGVNSRLGAYTGFVNLLDLSAVAVPAGTVDGGAFGVTVIARAFSDRVAADIARLVTGEGPAAGVPAGRPAGLPLVVVGAHMSGEPLNAQLSDHGAQFAGRVRTAAEYRMYALPTVPVKPGLVRVGQGGHHIDGELWLLPSARLGELASTLPEPMALGRLILDDGVSVTGFLCEPYAVTDAEDISHYGGWRAYRKTRTPHRISAEETV